MSENTTTGTLIALVIGLAITGFGGYMWVAETEPVNTYEKTDARVLSSEVSPGTGSSDYQPDITYEYTVDGETYESTNVYPGPGRTTKSEFEAEDVVENHSVGKTVTAYYDPEDPSEAFLVRKRNLATPLLAMGFGGLTVLLTLRWLVARLV